MLTSVIYRYMNVAQTQLQFIEPFICIQLYWIVTRGFTFTEKNHFAILYTTEDNVTDMYVKWCNWNTVNSTK
jgi:hypothetical protein